MKNVNPVSVSLSELVEITGLSKSALYAKKAEQNWSPDVETVRTGDSGRAAQLYLIESFPEDLKAKVYDHFERKKAQAELNKKVRAGKLTDKQLLRGNARHEYLVAYELFKAKKPKGRKSLEAFCEAVYAGEVEVDPQYTLEALAAKGIKMNLNKGNLSRWGSTLKAEGLDGLCGLGNKSRRGQSIINDQPDLKEWLESYAIKYSHIAMERKARKIKRSIEDEKAAKKKDWRVPSETSIRRWLGDFMESNRRQILFSTNIDKFNSAEMFNAGKHWPGDKPNDQWELDGTPADFFCVDGRYKITAGIDTYTRRVRCLLVKTQNSEENLALIRKMVEDFGMPNEDAIIKTDNGSDYVSKRITRAFHRVGMNQVRATPYSGKEKPYIERFFHTMSQDLFEDLPGYSGHNVEDRKKIENQIAFSERLAAKGDKNAEHRIFNVKLTAEEAQKRIDDWIKNVYEVREHEGFSGELAGKSPIEVYTQSRYQPRKPNQFVLALLMNEAGVGTVKAGQIRKNNVKYTAPELMEPEMNGARVEILINPDDPHEAFAIDLRNGYENAKPIRITNIEQVERRGMQQALVEARKKDMRELRRQDREYRRKAKELELDTLYERRAEVAKERLKNVTHFERKSSKYESPLFSNLEKAIEHGSSDAIADTVEAKSISEMLAEQQREKEELRTQEAPIRERR
ncbi:MAG: DDE-type integrase/transposase/recombinase, partial [Thiotrichales bacterium]|nr:DDE-type integrase/transposase/recombinase [Thiotrichales bacterium]